MKYVMHKLFHLFTLGLIASLNSLQAESLSEVYNQALVRDTQIREARANFEASALARPLARASLLPQISLSAETSDNYVKTVGNTFGVPGSSADYNSHGFSLRLDQPLYNHSLYVQLRQARNTVAKAQAILDASEQTLILRVAEAYFNILGAEDTLTFARSEKEASQRQHEQAKIRFEVGLAAITDMKDAQAVYDQAVAAEIDAKIAVELALDELAVIIGERIPEVTPLAINIALSRPNPESIEDWVETALKQNLSLLINNYDTKIAQQEIAKRQAAHLPTLDIVATHTDTDTGGISGSRHSKSSRIGLELSLPIFKGGRTYYSSKEGAYLYQAAQQSNIQLRREVTRDARMAYHNVVAAISRTEAFARATESAQLAATATELGFEVGTRNSVDVLLAQRRLFQAKRNHARARYDYLIDSLRLKQAAGILNSADLFEMEAWLQ
jgi:outer membrane protein|tara:strand:+ start:37250 stop:38578 length:1329 start_codon:yes stop_codon:yes gene_type:complete